MNDPTVCAVMLTADRPEMARRAVECFRSQTYANKTLAVLDTGRECPPRNATDPKRGEWWIWNSKYWNDGRSQPFLTIGGLRNEVSRFARSGAIDGSPVIVPDILIHWDDDDYSHPNRIAAQVALLQSSGADVVGYREMLFWRDARIEAVQNPMYESGMIYDPRILPGESWLYSNPNPSYALGTSLCYWRKTWERKPFEATSSGEDLKFITGLKCVTESAIPAAVATLAVLKRDRNPSAGIGLNFPPRMIARIHAGNTSQAYRPDLMAASQRQGGEWRRVPAWDSYCKGVMA